MCKCILLITVSCTFKQLNNVSVSTSIYYWSSFLNTSFYPSSFTMLSSKQQKATSGLVYLQSCFTNTIKIFDIPHLLVLVLHIIDSWPQRSCKSKLNQEKLLCPGKQLKRIQSAEFPRVRLSVRLWNQLVKHSGYFEHYHNQPFVIILNSSLESQNSLTGQDWQVENNGLICNELQPMLRWMWCDI